MFADVPSILDCGWEGFERILARLLICKDFAGVRLVGGSGDKGADILALHPSGTRWLVQAKYWKKPVPEAEVRNTVSATRLYRADVAVIAALSGVDTKARQFQREALAQGHSVTVWTPED